MPPLGSPAKMTGMDDENANLSNATPGTSFVCWSCQAVTEIHLAVELRREPRNIVPCCLGCWETMPAHQRLSVAQSFYDSQKLIAHQKKLENSAALAALAIERTTGAIRTYIEDVYGQ